MALASEEAVYLSNVTTELTFGKLLNSAPLFGDNTGALRVHVTGNSTYSSRTKHIALRFFFFLKAVTKGGNSTIHHLGTQEYFAEIEIKFLAKTVHRCLLRPINTYTTKYQLPGINKTKAIQDRPEKGPRHHDNDFDFS